MAHMLPPSLIAEFPSNEALISSIELASAYMVPPYMALLNVPLMFLMDMDDFRLEDVAKIPPPLPVILTTLGNSQLFIVRFSNSII